MNEAVDRERQAFAIMVATKPRTHNERLALIAYVDDRKRRELGTVAGKSWPRI